MKPSSAAYNLIKKFEFDGKIPPLTAYWDEYGQVWTIGWGHTRTAKKGMTITLKEAERLLKEDVDTAAKAVMRFVKIKLTQSMFDALVSFTFNVGTGALQLSSLLRLLNKGDIQGAANQFPRWIYSGYKKLNGLVRRREAEQRLFLQDAGIKSREAH